MNLILKEVSQKFNKNIKTHSFRTSFINYLLQITSLHIAKDIVGHKVVASTKIYYRSSLTKDKGIKILNQADKHKYTN